MKLAQIITRALMAGIGLMVLAGGLLLSGVGQTIDPLEFDPRTLNGDDDAMTELGQFRLAALEEYGEVAARPLFNDDRRPRADDATAEVTDDPAEDSDEQVALNVSVNGIIITESVKVALVKDNATKEVHRLKEGMPMEGDQGAWVLTAIEPRALVFEGGGEGEARVEMEVHKKALKGGAPAPRVVASRPGASAASPVSTADEDKAEAVRESQPAQTDEERAAKAEEIRRRVAERRAQLRAEAARRRAEQNKDKE